MKALSERRAQVSDIENKTLRVRSLMMCAMNNIDTRCTRSNYMSTFQSRVELSFDAGPLVFMCFATLHHYHSGGLRTPFALQDATSSRSSMGY